MTGILFVIYKTPFTVYMGLLYILTLNTAKKNPRGRRVELNFQTIAGIVLIITAPVFLIVGLRGYSSPSTFHAFFLAGLSLLFLETSENKVPLGILALEAFTAIAAKTVWFRTTIGALSNVFVDVTSVLVRVLIDLTGIPITMNGNTAMINDGIIIIGFGCSGLDAFVLYVVASILLSYLRESSREETALLLIGALGIIPLNALRIFVLLAIGHYSGIPFLELFHSHLGDLMFVVYVLAYWWLILKRSNSKEGSNKKR
nr:archaeosortase/exosortase family protein [Thermococcus sp. 21S7]